MAQPMRRNLCVAVFFSDIAGIDSRPATLLKKGFHQLDFPGNTLALLQNCLTLAPFLVKLRSTHQYEIFINIF